MPEQAGNARGHSRRAFSGTRDQYTAFDSAINAGVPPVQDATTLDIMAEQPRLPVVQLDRTSPY